MTQPVLVTGGSSGIGLATARTLADRGVTVYATVRREADAERLDRIDGVTAFVCDVTDDDQVTALREAIVARDAGLWGLVNNAGIAQFGHLTDTPLDDIRDVFEVNVFGVHRVTNTFIDLIAAGGGRIVNISSISGVLSSEYMGAYSMSKHALEAYTDALAAQWVDRGVHVCAVAPGNFESAIQTNMLKRFVTPAGASDEALQRSSEGEDTSRSWYPSPDVVAEAVHAALFEPDPQERYLVTPDEDEAHRTLRRAAWEMVRLNRSTPYRLSRSRLVTLLDEIDAARPERSS